jgi:hypothetical protein
MSSAYGNDRHGNPPRHDLGRVFFGLEAVNKKLAAGLKIVSCGQKG